MDWRIGRNGLASSAWRTGAIRSEKYMQLKLCGGRSFERGVQGAGELVRGQLAVVTHPIRLLSGAH